MKMLQQKLPVVDVKKEKKVVSSVNTSSYMDDLTNFILSELFGKNTFSEMLTEEGLLAESPQNMPVENHTDEENFSRNMDQANSEPTRIILCPDEITPYMEQYVGAKIHCETETIIKNENKIKLQEYARPQLVIGKDQLVDLAKFIAAEITPIIIKEIKQDEGANNKMEEMKEEIPEEGHEAEKMQLENDNKNTLGAFECTVFTLSAVGANTIYTIVKFPSYGYFWSLYGTMKTFENTFIRGPSPSYTDEATSDNAMALEVDHMQSSTDNFLDEKFNCVYDGYLYTLRPIKQGRNTFAFWTIVTILLVLTMANLLLTLTIIGVLHLGRGIHGMELIPEEDLIKFYGSTDLDRIYSKQSGQIEGFTDVPVTITADDGSVFVKMLAHRNGQPHNRIIIDKTGIQFRNVNTFDIKDPTNGDPIFTTHRPNYNMPSGAESLIAKSISSSRIASPIGNPLTISSDGNVSFKGSEGIVLDGSSSFFQAEHSITINSTQGTIVLVAGAGIFLDMDKIPIANSKSGLRAGSNHYKICVCMPKGILFRVIIPSSHNSTKITCAHFDSKHDPCAQ